MLYHFPTKTYKMQYTIAMRITHFRVDIHVIYLIELSECSLF